jgi:hypothetical protein
VFVCVCECVCVCVCGELCVEGAYVYVLALISGDRAFMSLRLADNDFY